MRSIAWFALFECKRANAQVTGLGEGDRGFHRLGVTDFSDQNDIRRLSKRVLQRILEGQGVESDFSLRDDRLLMLMNELDGIFDGDDMAWMDGIAIVDHGGQRRRFAGTGRAHDEHQSAFGHRDIFDDGREFELLDGLNLRLDVAEDESDISPLPEDVDAEPPKFLVVRAPDSSPSFLRIHPAVDRASGLRPAPRVARW